jgi:hypothetical protein
MPDRRVPSAANDRPEPDPAADTGDTEGAVMEFQVEPHFGYTLPSFALPPVGLILWFTLRRNKPGHASHCRRYALAGLLVYCAAVVLWFVLQLIMWIAIT